MVMEVVMHGYGFGYGYGYRKQAPSDPLLRPAVESPISTSSGLTLNKAYSVNPGLAQTKL